jgi:hypothetical protein
MMAPCSMRALLTPLLLLLLLLQVLDVLARQVGIIGIFSDWPAIVSYYWNCILRDDNKNNGMGKGNGDDNKENEDKDKGGKNRALNAAWF